LKGARRPLAGPEPAEKIELRNPADVRELVAVAPRAGVEIVDEALATAAGSKTERAAVSPVERGRALGRAAESLAARADALARMMTLEMGKAIAEARAEALDAAVQAGFGTAGQRCTCSSRIIVERPAFAEFSDRIREAAASLRVGPGWIPRPRWGR
jgi:acyl-CoA reductase-like NAD-dependent aldehyde dehydrogenase